MESLAGLHLTPALGEQAGAAHSGIEAPGDRREKQHQEVPVIAPADARAQEQAVVVLRASRGAVSTEVVCCDESAMQLRPDVTAISTGNCDTQGQGLQQALISTGKKPVCKCMPPPAVKACPRHHTYGKGAKHAL